MTKSIPSSHNEAMTYIAAVVSWLLLFCACIPPFAPVFHYYWYSSRDAVVVAPSPDHVGVAISPQGILQSFYDFMMLLILSAISVIMLLAMVMGLLTGVVEGFIRAVCEKRLARQAAGMVIIAYSQLVMTGNLMVVVYLSIGLSCMIGFMGLYSTAAHFHLRLDGISVACGCAIVQLACLGQYTAQAGCATVILVLCEVILFVGGDPKTLRGSLTLPWPISARAEEPQETALNWETRFSI